MNRYRIHLTRVAILTFITAIIFVVGPHIPSVYASKMVDVEKYVSSDGNNYFDQICIEDPSDVYFKIIVSNLGDALLQDVSINDTMWNYSIQLGGLNPGMALTVTDRVFISENIVNSATVEAFYNGHRFHDADTASASLPDASIMLLLGSSLIGLTIFSKRKYKES